MKNRKKLKKEIKKSFNALYKDIAFYKAFIPNADQQTAEVIMGKLPAMEDELLKRVSVNEGKYVQGRVKMYFGKLREDLKTQTNQIAEEIAALQ